MDNKIKDFTVSVSGLLDEGKYSDVINIFCDNKHADIVKNGSWELIPAIVSKIQENTLTITPGLHNACEKLLLIIVEKANPEEVLLEMLEVIESAKNYAQFLIILEPMQKIVVRLKNKQKRSLEWCFNSISTYIENIPIPEHNLEGSERLLLDSDDTVIRVQKIYARLPDFYNYFLEEAIIPDTPTETKKVITAFLVGLLGTPLLHFDVDLEISATSPATICCQDIITDICKLEKDILKMLVYVECKYKENTKSKNKSVINDSSDPYVHSEKMSITSLSGLLYVSLSGHSTLPEYALPQVYSPEYVVRCSLLGVLHLLNFTGYGPLSKGIALCESLLQRLSKPVPHKLLESQIYADVLKSLVNVAVFSTYEKIRKSAVHLIGKQVNMFDYKGRCMLVKSLLDMANHSGIMGYGITLYKNSIEEVFKSGMSFPECFSGIQFSEMLKNILQLPHGAESDLVELADQIITALNFIIYISLRDSENVTGIRDNFPMIETEYLDKLRIGLNMSKAHYEVKLKDIEEGIKHPKKKIEVSINVGGNTLDDIPLENQKHVIHSALNAFHLMEGLLARVSECINLKKSKI